MKRTAAYLAIAAIVMFLAGCSTLRRGTGNGEQDSGEMLVRQLSCEPAASELTASVRYEVMGRSFSGQLRMRRGHCIQLSAGLLGIEAFRVELFPDHVMIMDRTGRRYVECHYADLPQRDRLALDYSVIEAVFWNRLFSPECYTQEKLMMSLKAGQKASDGSVNIRDVEWGHVFSADADGHLTAFTKSGTGWSFNVGYSGFTEVEKDFVFPQQTAFELKVQNSAASDVKAVMRLSGISVANGKWKDETRPTSRMKPVGIEDIIELLEEM